MKTGNVVVIGAGGHAKVALDLLLALKTPVLGLADSRRELKGTRVLGAEVKGDDRWVESLSPSEVILVNGVGSTSNPAARRNVFTKFKARGFSFLTLVHPSAWIGSDVSLGEGTLVMAGARIQVGSCVGANSIINTGSCIDHDCAIGDHVHVAPAATLCGEVKVGAGSHIGAGATVIQTISIGTDCVIGAGSVVLKAVENGSKVFGVPARAKLDNPRNRD